MSDGIFDFSYFPALESERLILDEITAADVQALFKLFSDPVVTQYNDVQTFEQVSDAGWLVNFLKERFESKTGLRWGIRFKGEPGTLIGTCGYNVWMRHNNCAEIGYDLMPQHWSQGIMTEALVEMLRFGFEEMGLNRAEADVTPDNTASVRLLEKLGFEEEGLLRQRGYWKGEYHDLRFFSLLREEFEAMHD